VILVLRSKRKKGGGTSGSGVYRPTGTTRTIPPQQSAAVADQVRVHDPFFTEAEIREKVANLYVDMQRCWERQDWEPMRAHLTDDLFSQMGRQLNELVTRGQINKMERIAVMDVSLMSFHQDEQFDNLTLRLQTRLVDYTIDRRTGKVVSGDPKREKFMTYDWTMIRTLGTKTTALGLDRKDKATSFNCPHCGAPIDLTQSARCAYCGSIVKAAEFDWVLSKIRGVSQRTV
jgi:predicted lipid-binding transport protein (Tim44 family)/ribosomal protein L37E